MALKEAGFTSEEVIEVLMEKGLSAQEAKGAGYTKEQMLAAGFSEEDAKAALADLKESGMSAEQAGDSGYSPAQLAQVGYTPDEILGGLAENSDGMTAAQASDTTGDGRPDLC